MVALNEVVFSRETLDAWKSIFEDNKIRRVRSVVVVTLAHAVCVWLLLKLPPVIDLNKVKSGAPSVSVRFVEKPAILKSPPLVSKHQNKVQDLKAVAAQPKREMRWLTSPESRVLIPLEPETPRTVATPAPSVDVGPSWSNPGLQQLLPNSSASFLGQARKFGETWGQQNDEGGDGDGGQAVDVQTREFKYASYFQGLIRQIEQVWVYPELAARTGMQGQAIYDIVVKRDGTLQKVVAVKSSGFMVLDSEVERAVRAAGPYNPIPSRIERDPLVIRIRFVYTLTRFGIF